MSIYFAMAGLTPILGFLTIYPRQLLPTTGLHKISDVTGVLAVEDNVFPDPLEYLKEEV